MLTVAIGTPEELRRNRGDWVERTIWWGVQNVVAAQRRHASGLHIRDLPPGCQRDLVSVLRSKTRTTVRTVAVAACSHGP